MGKVLVAILAVAVCHWSVLHGVADEDEGDPLEYLIAHNKVRSEVGVWPLKWSNDLANAATWLVQRQAKRKGCALADLRDTKYGGNQFWDSSNELAPRDIVNQWVEERRYYNYVRNSCIPRSRHCGAYTQVVWGKSAELGCAEAACANRAGALTMCLYNPPGNDAAQRPF